MPADRFLRHRGLIALAVGGAVVQAGLLSVFAPAARPLAPQVTALPPLGIFYDLRWLFGYNRSWDGFALTLFPERWDRWDQLRAAVDSHVPADRRENKDADHPAFNSH